MATILPLAANSDKPDTRAENRLFDGLGRVITDLRVSVTDRCNYRCVYCRTGEEGPQFSELPMEDYLRMVRLLVSLGITDGSSTEVSGEGVEENLPVVLGEKAQAAAAEVNNPFAPPKIPRNKRDAKKQ